MQKALKQINIKLHPVTSDIDGKSGLAIINAILSGERDAEKLADLCDVRIKASHEEIIKSLTSWLVLTPNTKYPAVKSSVTMFPKRSSMPGRYSEWRQ
jgi:hypothetical protein